MGEIFRSTYRYGQVAHSEKERDLRKIIFYANAELDRLANIKQLELGLGEDNGGTTPKA